MIEIFVAAAFALFPTMFRIVGWKVWESNVGINRSSIRPESALNRNRPCFHHNQNDGVKEGEIYGHTWQDIFIGINFIVFSFVLVLVFIHIGEYSR